MQTGDRLVHQSALIIAQQIKGCFGLFSLLFVPGHQNMVAQSSGDLHGGNARAGRDARRHL